MIADVEVLLNENPLQIPTFNGYSHEYIRFVVLRFVLNGVAQQLTVFQNVKSSKLPTYTGHLFLPFTDDTNGKESYGGGRYIDINLKDIREGHIEIDFNKAYNPYCAYSDNYQCPKPPAENNIALKVEAGEKKFGKNKKH